MEGYRFAWGRLLDAWAQEPGDSPEALAVHSVADRTSRGWGGTLGKLWKFAMGSPVQGKAAKRGCLPGARPLHARRAPFVLTIPTYQWQQLPILPL